jgi:hypothetical protein
VFEKYTARVFAPRVFLFSTGHESKANLVWQTQATCGRRRWGALQADRRRPLRPRLQQRKVLTWPKKYKLAHAFL